MPYQLDIPLEKDYPLKKTDKLNKISADEPTMITVKQATQGQHERRENLFSQIIREVVQDAPEDVVRLVSRFSMAELMRIECYLTVTACNIKNSAGRDLFEYNSKGQITEAKFREAWDALPPSIADEIHECVLDLNVAWRPGGE